MIRAILQLIGLVVAVAAVVAPAGASAQSQIAFGVIEDRGMNVLIDRGPLAEAVRSALTRRLVRLVSGSDLPRLDLADAMRVSSDGMMVSFRVRSGVELSNGNELASEDVRFSLERCATLVGAGHFSVHRRSEFNPSTDQQELWIDVRSGSGVGTDTVVRFVADCPVVEARSSAIFGKSLGEGSNLVAAGDFSIRAFTARGDLELQRRGASATSRDRADLLAFRRLESEKAGITALRVGTIDGLLVSSLSQNALEGDETLQVQACAGFTIVSRRGLVVVCDGGLQLGEAHYVR